MTACFNEKRETPWLRRFVSTEVLTLVLLVGLGMSVAGVRLNAAARSKVGPSAHQFESVQGSWLTNVGLFLAIASLVTIAIVAPKQRYVRRKVGWTEAFTGSLWTTLWTTLGSLSASALNGTVTPLKGLVFAATFLVGTTLIRRFRGVSEKENGDSVSPVNLK